MPRSVAPILVVERSIHILRGQRVLLDVDLARLYGVPTKAFNQAVKRNAARFPVDFRFQVTAKEAAGLRSQSVTSSRHGGRRHPPWAFTQEGVAMLSGVLGSPRAIAVNVEIMRTFVKMRQAVAVNADLAQRLALVEATLDRHRAEFGKATAETGKALAEHAKHIRVVFETIRRLMTEDEPKPPARVGFTLP